MDQCCHHLLQSEGNDLDLRHRALALLIDTRGLADGHHQVHACAQMVSNGALDTLDMPKHLCSVTERGRAHDQSTMAANP